MIAAPRRARALWELVARAYTHTRFVFYPSSFFAIVGVILRIHTPRGGEEGAAQPRLPEPVLAAPLPATRARGAVPREKRKEKKAVPFPPFPPGEV